MYRFTVLVVFVTLLGGSIVQAAILAHYDGQTAGNAGNTNFNQAHFDSVDTDPLTDALRLTQGGGLDGGGSYQLVISNTTIFSPSPSSAGGAADRGYNLGHSNTASFAAATTANDYFELVINPLGGAEVLYESLTWWGDTNNAGNVGISIDGVQVDTVTPPSSNFAVELQTVDFADFTSSSPVTFRFTQWDAAHANAGVRYDDIIVNGVATATVVPEPSSIAIWSLIGLGLAGFGITRRRRRR